MLLSWCPLCCSNASVHPFTPVTGASAWYADQYKHNNEYIYDLSAEDVAELDAAVAAVMKSGKDLQVIFVVHRLSAHGTTQSQSVAILPGPFS